MKLIELRANKDSFHTVSFNPTGISLIVAVKETDDNKKTYNSVGKSLVIALVHFCLGSNSNPEFEQKLIDWEFTLEFEIDSKRFVSTRNTSNQKNITLNGDKLTLPQFREILQSRIFPSSINHKFISFRSLISRFIRPRKSSYVQYNEFIKEENDITQLMNNSFLLGLNTDLVLEKFELKEEFDKVRELRSRIEKDNMLKSFFHEGSTGDVEIKIIELESKSNQLQDNLKNFRIAEDYNKIKKEADQISNQLRLFRNQVVKLQNAINNINRSLKATPDISKAEIEKLFNEAFIYFNEKVQKQLEDVEEFNKKLISNREKQLLDERGKFERQLKEIELKVEELSVLEDAKLQYLNTHGALDEYTQLNRQLADIDKKLDKLLQYKKLVQEFRARHEQVKKSFYEGNIVANKYLSEAEPIVRKNIFLFKSFAEKFYSEKASGISVDVNEGLNRTRFEIRARIQDDTGDAVNEVKIFCFDWTLLKAKYNHKVEFIFHDSRITDGMDTRQVATIFRTANEECYLNNFQYIISANQNVLDALKSELDSLEYEELISNSIILKLSDKSEAEKLLGIELDINYEKEKLSTIQE